MQGFYVRTTSQSKPEVFSDRTDISAFTATNIHIHFCRWASTKIQHFNAVNRYRARLALDFNALACHFVQRLPLMLERRKHRWHLQDIANKFFQFTFNLRARNSIRSRFAQRLPIRIAGVGAHTQAKSTAITLVSVEQKLRKFGCLAKTQWQHACRQRIKTTGMTRLFNKKQSLCNLQRAI